jgi:hypothetical protein
MKDVWCFGQGVKEQMGRRNKLEKRDSFGRKFMQVRIVE